MFSSRPALLLKAALVLLLLWGLVWAGRRFTRTKIPTPEGVIAYVDENPITEIEEPEKRREVIGHIADMLNQLPPEDFEKLIEEGETDPRREFFEAMTEEEQRFFMEKRIGKAFDQMMLAFNNMEREERQRVVERTLQQMRGNGNRREGLKRLEETDPEMAEKIINEGLRAYYQKADAETKLDLAPVLEQMQSNLGGGGPRHHR